MKNLIIKLTLIALAFKTIESTELFGKDATEKFPGICLVFTNQIVLLFSGYLSLQDIKLIKLCEYFFPFSKCCSNVCFMKRRVFMATKYSMN